MSNKRTHWITHAVAAAIVVAVQLGTTPNAVAQTGVITGTVTHAVTGAPVAVGAVMLCGPTACTSAALNASGVYSATVAAGTYVAHTSTGSLADEIFDDVPCPILCTPTKARELGAPIVVTAGSKALRDFALSPFGSVTGRALDSVTGAPIAGLRVVIGTRFGADTQSAFTATAASGAFTFQLLGPGTFHAFTESGSQPTHANEIFDDVLCVAQCSQLTAAQSGSPIVVTPGAVTMGVDFLLDPGATITGTVRTPPVVGGQSVLEVELYVRVGSTMRLVRTATTDVAGAYRFSGLHAGSYFLGTDSSAFIDEVHDNQPCASRCQNDEIARGNPVTVGIGGTASSVDFDLVIGGSLSGILTEVGTGTPVAGRVDVYRRVGQRAILEGSATAAASGAYTMRGLASGTYSVLAIGTAHVPQLFGGPSCVACPILDGVAVAVTSGLNTQGVNFVLERGATISGTVRRSPSNATVSGAAVLLFGGGSPPTFQFGPTTNTAGTYSLGQLPAGTYFAATSTSDLANEVHDNVLCPGGTCSSAFAASNGTPITLAANAVVTGIDFTLGPPSGVPGGPRSLAVANVPGGVQFTWSAPTRGGAPTSYVFEAGLTAGTTFAAVPVATTSLFVPGVPPGTYFVRVRAINASGSGDASAELTLLVGAGGVVAPNAPNNVEPFVSAGRLSVTWRAPFTDPAPSGYLFEVGSRVGLSDIAVVPVGAAQFRFNGVPPGFYFVRVRAVAGGVAGPPTTDVVLVAGNVAAPPTQPLGFSSSVSNGTVTLTWLAPTFGPVTSYVLEAGTASGLSNIAVFNTGNAATSLVVPGVPPGTYHLRLRAVNALGTSPPSFEDILVVP